MDDFIGSIKMWAVSYEPEGWFFCDGRLLPIVQYQALYALLGTTYGGDGRTNFALPDLRGRIPVGAGQNYQSNAHQLGDKAEIRLNEENDAKNVISMLAINYIICYMGIFPPRQ